MNINQIFGKNVRKYRISKGISQEKLAHLSEIDRTYLPSIEKGKRRISLEVALKIASALNISLENLITQTENE